MMGCYEESYTEFKRAIRLDPHDAYTYVAFGFACYCARRYDQAIELFVKSLDLDPRIAQAHLGLGWVYLRKATHEAAITELQKAVELSQRAPLFLGFLGEAYGAARLRDKARDILGQLQDISKQRYVTPYMVGRVYTALEERGEALGWLETGLRERAAIMVFLKTDPALDSLRSDPRFLNLVRRMNFP